MDRTSRPTWLVEPCPPWCVRAHGEADHAEDRYHHAEPILVPCVLLERGGADLVLSPTARDLLVCRGRHLGEGVEWVTVEAAEGPEPRLVLTLESARRLLGALETVLEGGS